MASGVSVVIPFFNASRTIDDAIASVRAQTRPADEVVVVDDGSRPEEARALDRHASGVTLIRLPRNSGPSVARNIGIVAARGEWIAFLDADDLWTHDKLEKQLAYIEQTPDCRAIHASVRNISVDGQETLNLKTPLTFESFLEFPCPISLPTVMMKRSALVETGLFDPTKRCCEDLDLWMRFCRSDTFHCVADPLLIRRTQPNGLSRNNATFWQEADRVYRDFRWLFEDQDRAADTTNELHADFMLRAIYARDFKLLGKIVRRAATREVVLPRVLAKVAAGLIKGRLDRAREKQG
jgi:glycosyltransferase involved in cell wall biosynthesis